MQLKEVPQLPPAHGLPEGKSAFDGFSFTPHARAAYAAGLITIMAATVATAPDVPTAARNFFFAENIAVAIDHFRRHGLGLNLGQFLSKLSW